MYRVSHGRSSAQQTPSLHETGSRTQLQDVQTGRSRGPGALPTSSSSARALPCRIRHAATIILRGPPSDIREPAEHSLGPNTRLHTPLYVHLGPAHQLIPEHQRSYMSDAHSPPSEPMLLLPLPFLLPIHLGRPLWPIAPFKSIASCMQGLQIFSHELLESSIAIASMDLYRNESQLLWRAHLAHLRTHASCTGRLIDSL